MGILRRLGLVGLAIFAGGLLVYRCGVVQYWGDCHSSAGPPGATHKTVIAPSDGVRDRQSISSEIPCRQPPEPPIDPTADPSSIGPLPRIPDSIWILATAKAARSDPALISEMEVLLASNQTTDVEKALLAVLGLCHTNQALEVLERATNRVSGVNVQVAILALACNPIGDEEELKAGTFDVVRMLIGRQSHPLAALEASALARCLPRVIHQVPDYALASLFLGRLPLDEPTRILLESRLTLSNPPRERRDHLARLFVQDALIEGGAGLTQLFGLFASEAGSRIGWALSDRAHSLDQGSVQRLRLVASKSNDPRLIAALYAAIIQSGSSLPADVIALQTNREIGVVVDCLCGMRQIPPGAPSQLARAILPTVRDAESEARIIERLPAAEPECTLLARNLALSPSTERTVRLASLQLLLASDYAERAADLELLSHDPDEGISSRAAGLDRKGP